MTTSNDFYRVNYGNLKFYLRKNVISDYWVFEGLLFANEYYPINLRKEDVLLDVGANIGIYTTYSSRLVKRVIAIEPEPNNFELLSYNIKSNNLINVNLLNYAVSNKKEMVKFETTGGLAVASYGPGRQIVAETLDNLIRIAGNPAVTVLKMDIEGFESKALKGLSEFGGIREVIIETHNKKLTAEVTSFLSHRGFVVEDVSRIKRSKVLKNVLKHPRSFMAIEKMNNYATIKGVYRTLFLGNPSIVASDNEGSEQRIIYGKLLH